MITMSFMDGSRAAFTPLASIVPPGVEIDYSAASTGQRSWAEFGSERLTVFSLGPITTVAAPLVNQRPGRSGRKIVDRPARVTVVLPSAVPVMKAGPEMFTSIPLPGRSLVMNVFSEPVIIAG